VADGTVTNSGGRYDPVHDTWQATSTVGAPSSRHQHTAVWTGNRMIVWGGAMLPPFPSTPPEAAIYDPVGDTWSFGRNDAPSGTVQHRTVWTGDEMLVWGGWPTPVRLRYDPTNDLWQEMNEAGSPMSRTGFTAVWTGHSLLIWGGHSTVVGEGLYNTGAVYDPSADTWQATSLSDAPVPRENHSAVWTGTEMIVWGGSADGLYYDHGARYLTPSTDGDLDGFDECDGDCADADDAVHPGAPELCDGLDNDCGGTIDEGFATPGPTASLAFSNGTGITWAAEPLADRYDLVRGDLVQLVASGGDFTASLTTCLVDDGPGLSAFDAEPLAPQSGFYYLVRAQRDCKSGPYATGAPGEQPGRDGEIAASATACP
jgi:hypothetical protein